MKKRLISFMLAVLMVATLFSGMTVSASADATVTTVTLGQDQTVLGLCQKLGVDYYAHKNLIMTLNGFTSEGQFSKLAVGSKIVLPVSNAAALALSQNGTGSTGTIAGTGTNVGTTGTGTGLTTGTMSTLPTGDYVSYYLVNYTIRSGETIAGIYNNWGLSYKTYSNQILKLNNISSYNSIPAGKTLWLPTTNPSVAGAQYYTVMAHPMKSGESAYNIICADYGLNFNAVQKMAQSLNNRDNLANFYVGETLYIPVAGIVSANTNVTPGVGSTGSSSTTGSVNTSANYNLVSQTPTNGSFALEVNGVTANTAAAGQTVKVIATPNTGYGVESIRVVSVSNASVSVPVAADGSFTMPGYAVTVSVTFRQAAAYDVTLAAATNGSVAAMVNDVRIDKAYVGNRVTVKTIPNTGFILDDIRVTYNDNKDSILDYVAVENGSFIMPNYPVTVQVTFKDDPNFDPTKGHNIYTEISNGKIETKIGNDLALNAHAGDRVSVAVTPDANYTLQNLTVYYSDFSRTVDMEKGAFIMPDCPVTIVATVKPTADAAFAITKVSNTEGTFTLKVDDTEVSSAKVGQKVKIDGKAYNSYFNFQATVTKTGDSSVSVPVETDNTFVMPDYPVTVRLKFYTYHNIILDASNGTRGWFKVVAPNGMEINKCGAGVELKITVWGYNANVYYPSAIILTYEDGSVYDIVGGSFIMPDCDVKVRVNFSEVTKLEANPIADPQNAGNSYTVLGTTVGDRPNSRAAVLNAGFGARIWIVPNCALGYQAKTFSYKYTALVDDGTGNIIEQVTERTANYDAETGRYWFQMPDMDEVKSGTNVELSASFQQISTYSINVDYSQDYYIPAGTYDGIPRGNVTAATSMGTVTNAIEGARVTLLFGAKAGYKNDPANVRIVDVSGNDVTTAIKFNRNDCSFFMPAYDIWVLPAFNAIEHKITVAEIPLMADGTRPEGILRVQVDGADIYTDDMLNADRELPIKIKAGTLITVINESRTGYILRDINPIVVTMAHGGASPVVTMIDDDRFSFQMPDDDVTIQAHYVYDTYNIVANPTTGGTYEVAKQANWGKDAATAETVTVNVVPESGYMLDSITISYYDSTGKPIVTVLDGNTFQLIASAKPLSDVFVDVKFKPVPNRMNIKYQFNGLPSEEYLYKVDLAVGNKPVTIDRNFVFDLTDPAAPDYSGYVDTVGVNDPETGIKTGDTVIIRRNNTSGRYDNNFVISDIFVLLNGVQLDIKKVESSGDYYFVMPSVTSSDTLEVNVIFTKLEPNKVSLVAISSGGGEADFVFTDSTGNRIDTAAPNQDVSYTITAKPGSQEDTSFDVYYTYTDLDGNEKTVTGVSGSFTVPTDAKSKTSITLYYKVIPLQYSIDSLTVDSVGNPVGSVEYIDPNTAGSITAQSWGNSNLVNVIPEKVPGYSVSSVTISYTPLDTTTHAAVSDQEISKISDATEYVESIWQFSVPVAVDGNVTVTVTYAISGSSITINSVNGDTPHTVPAPTMALPVDGKIPAGEMVRLDFQPLDGYTYNPSDFSTFITSNNTNIDVGTDLLPITDAYGNVVACEFSMPNGSVDLLVSYKQITYSVKVSHIGDGTYPDARQNTYILVDGVYVGDGTTVAQASVGNWVSVVPMPGYKIAAREISWYDKNGVQCFGTGLNDGRGVKFLIGGVPTDTINFTILLNAAAEAYALNEAIESNGSDAGALVYFTRTGTTTKVNNAGYGEAITANITLDPAYNFNTIELRYEDYLGNARSDDLTYNLVTGVDPGTYTLDFSSADLSYPIKPGSTLRIVYTAN